MRTQEELIKEVVTENWGPPTHFHVDHRPCVWGSWLHICYVFKHTQPVQTGIHQCVGDGEAGVAPLKETMGQARLQMKEMSPDPWDILSFSSSIKYLKILLLILREREREEGGEKHRLLSHLLMHLLVDSCMCPDQGLNPQPWCIGLMPYPTELPSQHNFSSFDF